MPLGSDDADNSIVGAAVREYRIEDETEFLRLLRLMYQDMHGVYGGTPPALDADWEQQLLAAIESRLNRDIAIYVVEGDQGKLASLAGGRVSEGLPSPRRLHTREGYIEWVVTDAECRKRGHASAAIMGLLDWFREAGALSVSLNSSPAAESMYASLGFSAEGPRAFSLRLDE